MKSQLSLAHVTRNIKYKKETKINANRRSTTAHTNANTD